MLHSNRELFEQAILRTADATGIAASIIEKDYYVTEFLRRMTSYQPDMVFKGGTSLSKCYKLIQRFSEDIDLNVEDRPSEGQRKALKRNILAVVDDLGLSLSNAVASLSISTGKYPQISNTTAYSLFFSVFIIHVSLQNSMVFHKGRCVFCA